MMIDSPSKGPESSRPRTYASSAPLISDPYCSFAGKNLTVRVMRQGDPVEASAADFVIWAKQWTGPMGDLCQQNDMYAVHGVGVDWTRRG